MKKIRIAILISCAFLFIYFSILPVFADFLNQDIQTRAPSLKECPNNIILAQTQNRKEKYSCLDLCAKKQYQCESGNTKKNQIGRKKHWEGSRDCEKLYRKCIDSCQ